MDNRNIEEAKRYHELTKHSYQSVRRRTHALDGDNRPSVYKVYPDLAPIPLPRDFAWPEADTLRAMSSPECNEEKAPGLKELSQILFFSAGLTKKKTYPGGEERHFRAAACAGALYLIEIYVICADLDGLAAGIYHFNPGDFALKRLRLGDYRSEASLISEEEIRPWRGACLRPQPAAKNRAVPLGPLSERSPPLGKAILKRGSTRCFAREAISFAELSTMLHHATRGIPADFLEGPETSLLDLYLIVNDVERLDAGFYYFSPTQRKLDLLQTNQKRG